MSRRINIAVIGAKTLAGEAILSLLGERKFPCAEVFALEHADVMGEPVDFAGGELILQDMGNFDFTKVEIVFFAASEEVTARLAVAASEAGCVVIDNSAYYRNDPYIPLIIPSVNSEALSDVSPGSIVASPNSATVQMLVALKPLHDIAKITRINVVCYQAVSGFGRSGVDELASQAANLLNARPLTPKVFPKQIAFNVLAQSGEPLESGFTEQELALIHETGRVLNASDVLVNATVTPVSVFFGYSMALHIETERKITRDEAISVLSVTEGVVLADDGAHGDYPTAVTDAASDDAILIGRIREDLSHPRGLNLWVVADNVRRGVAMNNVQLAECYISKHVH